MGQDSEAAAEFVMTVRTDHVKMKQWYTDATNIESLKSKYGPYPSMWKEVLNWQGWKDVRKEYLKQQQETPSSASSSSSSVPRKRKSRWGAAPPPSPAAATEEQKPNKRQSRWARSSTSTGPPTLQPPPPRGPSAPISIPGMPSNMPAHKQEELRRLQGELRRVNDRMQNLDREAARIDALPRGHRDRSPSPPPVYGADGKRKNTRAVRWRERFSNQRQDLLEKIMNLNPNNRQSNLFVRKRTKKIPIPIDKHPTYNFIGLIIGPRGKTQKELEAKTGCKIAIRGRGSVKEGARGRRDGKVMEGDHEPLHVVVTGDDQRAVDAAVEMVTQMLVVIDDEKNVHKQQQLRELALLNGTLKDEEFCPICGEKGHRAFECPRRFAQNNRANNMTVRCAICGDTSHPTRDCRQRPDAGGTPANSDKIDSEYMSFMAELDGKKAEQKGPPAAPTGGPPPLPPPTGLPPLPTGGPPPPPPAAPAGLPPPPPPGAATAPGNTAPQQSYYGHHHQQQQQHQKQPGYGGQGQPYGYGQQQGYQQNAQQRQHQQQAQVQPGQETAGWDPNSYYGSSNGAGGLNWWDN